MDSKYVNISVTDDIQYNYNDPFDYLKLKLSNVTMSRSFFNNQQFPYYKIEILQCNWCIIVSVDTLA